MKSIKTFKPEHNQWIEDFFDKTYGEITLYQFQRAMFKYTDTGIMTGFVFYKGLDGRETIWNDDLPRRTLKELENDNMFIGCMLLCGYVEGSDVELQPYELKTKEDFEKFDQIVKNIEDEVTFYWERDNEGKYPEDAVY